MIESNYHMTHPSPLKRHPAGFHNHHHHHHQHQHAHHYQHSHPPSPPMALSPPRIHTLDLKAKLATALGNHGKRYWNALLHFCTAKTSRDEFEVEARSCLRAEDVHLHNALVLGILYNASSAVPGPSCTRGHRGLLSSTHIEPIAGQAADGRPPAADGANATSSLPPELFCDAIHPRKRLRLLAASLSGKERQRIKTAGRTAAKPVVTGASASSWAGAGADLLEKRRKEEEKKAKEAEKRRLRELHTQIGADDWMQQAILEEATRQENRSKQLPVATLQALLRSRKVPLCSESKSLPDADSLADLMTSQAVEAGLSGGVSADAAALVLAGVQAHLQNLASSIILAVRSNRPTGGIRTSKHQSMLHDAHPSAADTSVGSHGAASSYLESPVTSMVLQLPDPQLGTAYSAVLHGRAVGEDILSRTNSGANSIFSMAPSSIFTTGRHHGVSGPDSSTTSFASTATTSFANGLTSDEGSEAEPAASKKRAAEDEIDVDKAGIDSSHTADRTADSGIVLEILPVKPLPPLPHRPHFSQAKDKKPSQGGLRPKLGLRDAAFLFEMSPHIVVEPLGLSAMEKMLCADDASDDEQDENLPTDTAITLLKNPELLTRLGQEERLALAARQSALSNAFDASSFGEAQTHSSSQRQGQVGRQRYVVNQQAPLSLILDADFRKEKEQTAASSEGTSKEIISEIATMGTATSKRTRAKDQDPLSDVVDPVKLLVGLCD